MKITKLAVSQFEGLTALEVTPSNGVNLVEGHNGAGKTSLLEAIRVAFTNKGQRSQLVQDGGDQGLILFELDDGTAGERSVSGGGRVAGPITLQHQGQHISAAQRFLNNLGLGFGFNPLEFIELRDDQQTKQLLDITPMNIAMPELLKLGGGRLDDVNYHEHPLQVLAAIEKSLLDQRRAVGRDARDLEGMAERLYQQVPNDFDAEAFADFDLGEAVAELNKAQAHKLNIQETKESLSLIENEIKNLQQQLEKLKIEREDLRMTLTELREVTPPNTEQISNDIAQYKENAEHAAQLEQAKVREQEAVSKRQEYTDLSLRIEAVRAKPGELLPNTELPVVGLGIDEDGKVTINGLPISELSTGEQLGVAVDIAVATLGELKVVLVDGLERLDKENQDALLNRLSMVGVQAFVTKVTDTELTVITDYQPSNVPF